MKMIIILLLFLVRVHFTGKKSNWKDNLIIIYIKNQNGFTWAPYPTPSENLEFFESGKGYWLNIFLTILKAA